MTTAIPVNQAIALPPCGTWPDAVHLFDQASADALLAARLARRPLLVCGEPGSGKSQLARAAAFQLKRAFISCVVHARTEAQDLQWEFDAVARLGEAQALGAAGTEQERLARLDPRRYLLPGRLWWAFHWQSATDHVDKFSLRKTAPPSQPAGCSHVQGTVLLLDEIDKADADLPNSLLEILGNGAFGVPWLAAAVGVQRDTPPPLVVITTNGERDMPAAFLRRCMVLRLDLPTERNALVEFLVERGQHHFGDRCAPALCATVAGKLAEDREGARKIGAVAPGQAEYLDILRVLVEAHPGDPSAQEALFERVARFALDKAVAVRP
jgi:MoxR-like ATPase